MIRLFAFIFVVILLFVSLISCSKEDPVIKDKGGSAQVLSESVDAGGVDEIEGSKIFIQKCRSCHGEGGRGDICPDLTDSEWKYGNSDKDLFESISAGRRGGMPGWANSLSDIEIEELIEYIRRISEN